MALDVYIAVPSITLLITSLMYNCRYPGTSFMDHIMRYQENPEVKMIVVLGEVRHVHNCVIKFRN